MLVAWSICAFPGSFRPQQNTRRTSAMNALATYPRSCRPHSTAWPIPTSIAAAGRHSPCSDSVPWVARRRESRRFKVSE